MTRLKWSTIDIETIGTDQFLLTGKKTISAFIHLYELRARIVITDEEDSYLDGFSVSSLKRKVKKEFKKAGVKFYDEIRRK